MKFEHILLKKHIRDNDQGTQHPINLKWIPQHISTLKKL
jgi:hypothetical protein